jgi:hypothetical protein
MDVRVHNMKDPILVLTWKGNGTFRLRSIGEANADFRIVKVEHLDVQLSGGRTSGNSRDWRGIWFRDIHPKEWHSRAKKSDRDSGGSGEQKT